MYLGIGKYAEAENYLQKSYRILDSIGTKDNKLIPLSALARLYLAQNKLDKAKKTGEQVLAFATAYHDKLFLRDACNVLSAIAKKRNQPAQALVYFEAFKNWNDSIYNEKRIKGIEDVESRLKLQKNELEVKYLSDKRNEENKELKQSNIGLQATTIAILVLSLVLLIVGGVLWQSNRSRGRKNLELEKQKQVIERQSHEKDTLIREINHRVKNNLQVISSLLNLQANSLSDPAATEALRDSHMRVKAISMIHQKLYGYEENASIPLGAYINSLFADLRMVFAAVHIQLDCSTEPDGLLLDMESAVPLGLILNETITNALKYAFQNKPAGKITIRMIETANQDYVLTVQDDGNGLPEGFDEANAGSLGFRIIRELSRQLRGKYQYTNNLGTCFTLHFPNTTRRNRRS
jgi:two-component sensor histidine kinase